MLEGFAMKLEEGLRGDMRRASARSCMKACQTPLREVGHKVIGRGDFNAEIIINSNNDPPLLLAVVLDQFPATRSGTPLTSLVMISHLCFICHIETTARGKSADKLDEIRDSLPHHGQPFILL